MVWINEIDSAKNMDEVVIGTNDSRLRSTMLTEIITELLPEMSKSVSVIKKSSETQFCICIQKYFRTTGNLYL